MVSISPRNLRPIDVNNLISKNKLSGLSNMEISVSRHTGAKNRSVCRRIQLSMFAREKLTVPRLGDLKRTRLGKPGRNGRVNLFLENAEVAKFRPIDFA